MQSNWGRTSEPCVPLASPHVSGPELSDDLVWVARQYPLTRLRTVRMLPTTGRNINAVMIDGEGARFVLRCHRRNPDRVRIEFQLDFQEHLRGNGIPTAEIITTGTGERLIDDGRRTWVLFRHMPGTAYDYLSEQELRSAALPRYCADMSRECASCLGTWRDVDVVREPGNHVVMVCRIAVARILQPRLRARKDPVSYGACRVSRRVWSTAGGCRGWLGYGLPVCVGGSGSAVSVAAGYARVAAGGSSGVAGDRCGGAV